VHELRGDRDGGGRDVQRHGAGGEHELQLSGAGDGRGGESARVRERGERKAARDAQSKQLEDTIKELQKDLQSCRLKLAKLEGQLPMVAPMSPAKPLAGPVGPKDESDED